MERAGAVSVALELESDLLLLRSDLLGSEAGGFLGADSLDSLWPEELLLAEVISEELLLEEVISEELLLEERLRRRLERFIFASRRIRPTFERSITPRMKSTSTTSLSG
ncbi:MAG: hypothetical protein JKY65_10890 [Planctomycetes bacterium]|nr:hypothetical protein [Planctomycetota bacterium]